MIIVEVIYMMEKYFEEIHDPRQQAKVQHKLSEIIVLVICAVISGCDVWEDIADFCRVKLEWFRVALGLELRNGIPSHDTMERVFEMMDPKEFEQSFAQWVEDTCSVKGRETISIDGKTLRGSQSKAQKAIHMVSAWAHDAGLVLGQIATEEKSNEITAVPALLDTLDIEDCIVTADAMSCQKAITKKIAIQKGDYVIGLKENQATLYEEAVKYFAGAAEEPKLYQAVATEIVENKGHGREEKRVYSLCQATDILDTYRDWANLRAIGKVHSVITQNGVTTEADRYYITSLTDVKEFARAARNHWGIENSLHWCLDVTFREDASRTRKDHSAENFAVIRHFALSVLKSMKDNMSVARRRRHCAYDDEYLAHVILSIHA